MVMSVGEWRLMFDVQGKVGLTVARGYQGRAAGSRGMCRYGRLALMEPFKREMTPHKYNARPWRAGNYQEDSSGLSLACAIIFLGSP